LYEVKLSVKPQRSFKSRNVDLAANCHFAESGHSNIQLFRDAAPRFMKFAQSEAAMCLDCGWNTYRNSPPWKVGRA